jgi:hypothetical protein
VAAPSYLVVYLARPELPGRHWWQPTNDPELRGGDMTWGICRPNVRGIRNIVGANLFFVACDPQRLLSDRYHLTTYFHVGEAISHPAALQRYPGRPNVLIDHLPGGGTIAECVESYARLHGERIRWWAEVGKSRERTDRLNIRKEAARYVVTHDDEVFIHAWWDHHSRIGTYRRAGRDILDPVWRHALTKPYLVADRTVSRVLAHPMPYFDLARRLNLPGSERLRNEANRHPYQSVTPILSKHCSNSLS